MLGNQNEKQQQPVGLQSTNNTLTDAAKIFFIMSLVALPLFELPTTLLLHYEIR